MKTPNFAPGMYVDDVLLSSAAQQHVGSLQAAEGALHTPGLIGGSAISVMANGLTLTVVFGSSFSGALFGSGVLAGAYGTTSGATANTYSVSLAGFVPASGTQEVYIVAQAGSIGQNPVAVSGPPVGHPDYDSSFVPSVVYAELLDSLVVLGGTVPPDNSTGLEIARCLLTAGSGSVTQIDLTHQVQAGAVLSRNGDVLPADLAPGAAVANLGFTPVQQGGGTGQGGNKLYLGWDSQGAGLRLQVDSTYIGILATQGYVTGAVGAESTRAQQAENTLYGEITTEINRAEAAEALLAPLQSPALGGTPHTPTPPAGDSSPQITNTSWVSSYYANLMSPAFQGTPHTPTPAAYDATPQIANTFWVSEYYLSLKGGQVNGNIEAGYFNTGGNWTSSTNPITSSTTGSQIGGGGVVCYSAQFAAAYFGTGTPNQHIVNLTNSQGSNIGSVQNINDNSIAYATSSDRRLKMNLLPITFDQAAARLQAVKPTEFEYKSDPGRRIQGVIADEHKAVYDYAVIGEPDAVHEDGSVKSQLVDLNLGMPADLVAAVLGLIAKVQALEAEVTALRARPG